MQQIDESYEHCDHKEAHMYLTTNNNTSIRTTRTKMATGLIDSMKLAGSVTECANAILCIGAIPRRHLILYGKHKNEQI